MVRHADIFPHRVRDMAYVGSESEFMITILDMVSHIISTIVRHLESRDTEITDKEWNFFFYNLARDT